MVIQTMVIEQQKLVYLSIRLVNILAFATGMNLYPNGVIQNFLLALGGKLCFCQQEKILMNVFIMTKNILDWPKPSFILY